MADIRGTILWWAAKRRIRKDRSKVIAVGGAIAKTSTKMAIGTLLKLQYPGEVRVGYGNLNSYLGVPLSILGFEIDFYERPIGVGGWLVILWKALWRGFFTRVPKYLVVEFGTDQPGDIEAITDQLPPDVGVMTIVGPAHLANYPSVDSMVKDEGYLAERTKPDGVLFVNSNDTYLTSHHQRAKARVVNVVAALEEIAIKFMEAIGRDLKIGEDVIEEARDTLVKPDRRFQFEQLGAVQLLDDSYNASPLAVKAALNLLKKMPGRKIAILGSMAELGVTSATLHREVGDYARSHSDLLISVGEEAKDYGAKHWFPDAETAADKVFEFLFNNGEDGGSILVKGSKSIHMEIVSKAIREKLSHMNN